MKVCVLFWVQVSYLLLQAQASFLLLQVQLSGCRYVLVKVPYLLLQVPYLLLHVPYLLLQVPYLLLQVPYLLQQVLVSGCRCRCVCSLVCRPSLPPAPAPGRSGHAGTLSPGTLREILGKIFLKGNVCKKQLFAVRGIYFERIHLGNILRE